jgi:hypothetical protein
VVRGPHEPPGREMRKKAVVVERPEADQERHKSNNRTDQRRQRGRLTQPRDVQNVR